MKVYEAICYDLQYQIIFANQQRLHKERFYILSIAFSIFSIRLITAGAVVDFFEIQTVSCIEHFGHSKIPLTFYP